MAKKLGKIMAIRTHQARLSAVAKNVVFYRGRRIDRPSDGPSVIHDWIEAVLPSHPLANGYYPSATVVMPWRAEMPRYGASTDPATRAHLTKVDADAVHVDLASAFIEALEYGTRNEPPPGFLN